MSPNSEQKTPSMKSKIIVGLLALILSCLPGDLISQTHGPGGGYVPPHTDPPTQTCRACRGSGNCYTCGGGGSVACPPQIRYVKNDGTNGFQNCSRCGGTGSRRCDMCHGSGKCYACGGSGQR